MHFHCIGDEPNRTPFCSWWMVKTNVLSPCQRPLRTVVKQMGCLRKCLQNMQSCRQRHSHHGRWERIACPKEPPQGHGLRRRGWERRSTLQHEASLQTKRLLLPCYYRNGQHVLLLGTSKDCWFWRIPISGIQNEEHWGVSVSELATSGSSL